MQLWMGGTYLDWDRLSKGFAGVLATELKG